MINNEKIVKSVVALTLDCTIFVVEMLNFGFFLSCKDSNVYIRK